MSSSLNDPIFLRTAINTLVFLIVAINVKMVIALFLSGFFTHKRWWVKILAVLFVLPWAVPSIPTIISVRFMLNPEWGVINQLIFKLTSEDGPNWLNDPTLALSLSMVVHIWKSLPFWTLILLAGRLAIPLELYEAASVDGAGGWHRFAYITWPSISTLYVTCTLLSMIFTVGDFNSVYLLTGGGPADLTHVLATLGIRYLRLDQVGMAMASIVCCLPLILPLVYLHDEAASSAMTRRKLFRDVSAEAGLLLIGIPVLLWTMIPIYHMFLFAISPKDAAFSGQLWPTHPTCATSRSCSARSTTSSIISGCRCGTRWRSPAPPRSSP